VSINKCCILSIGRIPPAAPADLYIDGQQMSLVSSCCDLGVLVLQDLKPTAHIKQMVASAHRRAHAILRSFWSGDIETLIHAFNVYVLSLLEYNSTVWSPQGKQDIECIERVLHRYPKRLPGLKSYSYKGRLKNRLNLTTLEMQRVHIDLVWCYKIVFGLVDVNFDDFFTLAPLSQTRGHKHKLCKQRCSMNVGTSFFANRVADSWNYLADNITDFNSLPAFKFKRTIKLIDFTMFLKCD